MAGQDVAELFVAGISGGHVWAAPVGTAPPVGLETPAAGWVDMGYLSEDGFGATPGLESEDIKVWPLLTTARTVLTEQSLEVKLAFAQWNADTLGFYFGGAWTDGTTHKTLSVPTVRATDWALVIDASDERTYRYVLERATLSDFEEITHKLGEPALLGCTMKVLPTSDTEWFRIVTDDEAVVVP
jgi:hypothetical protein